MFGLHLLLFSGLLAGFISAARQHYFVHKRAPEKYEQWERGPRANRDLIIPVQIDFTEKSLDEAAPDLLALSDPSSRSFNQHWSAQDVTLAFSLPEKDIQAILQWIVQTLGYPHPELRVSPCRCRLDFNATVGQMETLLKTEYYVYKRYNTGETSLACQYYSLPEELLGLIDFILPTVFPTSGSQVVQPALSLHATDLLLPDGASTAKRQTMLDCDKFTTPQCLRDWYHIPARQDNYPIHPNNSFGIFQVAWSSWIPADLDKFFDFFEPSLRDQRPQMQRIDGGYHNTEEQALHFNLEADLDFEYAMSLVWPQPVTNIQVGDMYASGNLNNMLAAFDEYYCAALDPDIDPVYPNLEFPDGYGSLDCGTHEPPKVISISYAWDEADFPPEYLRRQCQEYLKLGLQGVTVIASSGDEGTAGRQDACPDPANTGGETKYRPFRVSFPASCPWVTAVGGTMKNPASLITQGSRETVYNHASNKYINSSSTGGFSNVFGTPDYQSNSTRSYLAEEHDRITGFNLTGLFNSQGRGVPDISALAADYVVAVNGEFRRVFGTSAAAPVVASMIAMVNNERLLVGKGPVGFINPVLYAHPEIFEDVKHGENVGCHTDHGFRAIDGWDAATGLGSLDYERLLGLFLELS